ncbi:MAG: PKD domain-containing protein, partial [Flavobacteriales bacterium]|nr:PKD domain-containing protein [Flavobacteriales bacterium]
MVTDGTLSNPSTSIPNPTTITLEFPRNGKGCVNSEVNLTNVVASPWTLTGSTLLDNVNLGVSNYTFASNPVQVYYTSSGVYDVGASGAIYQDWIHIIDGTRPANATFNSASSTACSGSTVSIDAAPWGTELQWEWVLFSTNATVPIETQTTQTATFTMPSVTTTTVFNIRYRVNESCCGWSKPYYTTITVYPVTTPVIASSGGNAFCSGQSLTLSTTGGGTYQWSEGSTTSSVTVNTPGNYTVTVTDPNGCVSTSTPFAVSVNPLPTPAITAAGSSVICPPSDVTLQSTTAVGQTYTWNTGATTSSITTSTPGSYSVSVVDANGCTGASAPFTIYDMTANIFVDGSSTICQGGSVQVSVNSPYLDPATTFQWSMNGQVIAGATSASYAATQTGSYQVTLTNGSCTQTSASVQITVFTATVTSTNSATTLCPGTSLTLTASNGVSYQWQLNGTNITGATNQTYAATQGGSYTVVISDGTCNATSNVFTITEIVPTITSANGTNNLCPGSSLVLTASTGSNYQWQLNGTNIAGATSQTYTVTQAGSYTVSAIDPTGTCTSTSTAFVITEIIPTVTSSGGITTLCPGSSLILTSSAGTSYQWQLNGTNISGATSQTYSATQAGSYTVVVTDLAGTCTSTSTAFTITEIVPTVTGAGGSGTLCPGGSLVLTSSAGTSYQWQLNGTNIPGATSQTYAATQSGNYTVVVLDNAGTCTSTSTVFTVIDFSIVISSAGGDTSFCSGSSLTLTVPLNDTYQWQLNGVNISGATTQTYSATQGGSYTVVVNSGACSGTSNVFVVTEIIPTINSSSGSNVLCPGSSLTLTSSIGISYQWQLNGANIAGATNQTYTVTQGGSYTVVVLDQTGTCTSTSVAFVITEIVPTITSTGGTTALCPGTSITLTSSIGTSYQWQLNGANIAGATNQTYNATQAGSYNVVVLDVAGTCTSTSVAFVITDNVPTVTSSGGTTSICPGSSVLLTSSVGTSYQWQLNGTNITGAISQTYSATQGGSYTVVVLDATGTCTSTSVAFVITEIVPTITSTGGTSTLCPGSSLTLTSSLGTSYQWQLNGTNIAGATSQTYTLTQGGSYTVVVVDPTGACTSTSVAFVVTEIIPTVTSTGGATTLCPGSSLTLTSSVGTSYQWSLNGTNIVGATSQTYAATQAGSYTVTVLDATGTCTSTSTAFIITAIIPTVTSAGGATTLCPGSSLILTSSAGTSYQWQLNGTNIAGATSQTYTATQAGNYAVTVTNGTCTSTSNAFTLTLLTSTITSTGGATTLCPGSSLILTGSLGTSYQWQLNGTNIPGATSQTYSATQAGTYIVVVTSGTCSLTSSGFTITSIIPTVTSTGGATTLCPGSSLTLTSSVGNSYQWQLNGTNIAGATSQSYAATQAGTYTVVVTSGTCTSTSSAFVITAIIPTITSAGGIQIICQGSSLVLTSSAGTSYQWLLNGTNIAGATSQTYSVTQSGNYTVSVTNGTCTSTSVAFAVSVLSATISSTGGATALCPGSSLTLTSSGGASYQWQLNGVNIPGATAQTYAATQAGSYTVVVTTPACSATSTAYMITTITPTVTSTGGSTIICPGSSLTITASAGTAYQWQLNGVNIPGATSQSYAATQAGNYTATVTTGACTSTSNAFALTLSAASVPTISVSVDGGCVPLNVAFTSSQAINQAIWSVNGTNLPSGISSFNFLTAGCNNIGLSGVLSDGCTFNAVANSAVCIDPLPNAYFSTNPSAFNEDNQNIIFNNGSTNAVSYIWDFGNGNTSTQNTPSFTFTQNRGGHTVTLTAVSALGCTDVYSIFIPFSDNSDIFYVPNTFTPDDDEHNQTFQPVFTSGFDPYSFEMTIF